MQPTVASGPSDGPRQCNIARALELVGERWTLLVMREVLLGVTRFDQIVRNTGAPRNILAARLSSLVDAGLLSRRQYSDRPPRAEYLPTEAGRGIEPVLQTLMAWGDHHLGAPNDPPTVFQHSCGQPLRAQVVCACCGGKADRDSLTVVRVGGKAI